MSSVPSPSTSRLRLIVGRTVVVLPLVDDDGNPAPLSLSMKKLGHVRILDKAVRYPRLGQLLAEFIDGKASKAYTEGGIEKVLSEAADAGSGTKGALVSQLVAELPALVQELVVESIELEPGDTLDDMIYLVLSLDVDHFALLLNGFIGLNFSRGAAPLVAALQTFGTLKRKDADASSNESGTPSTDAKASAAA